MGFHFVFYCVNAVKIIRKGSLCFSVGDAKLEYVSEIIEFPCIRQDADIVVGDGEQVQVNQVIDRFPPQDLKSDLGAAESVDPSGKVCTGYLDRFVLSAPVKANRDGTGSEDDFLRNISPRVVADDPVAAGF
jgi:hypothetical protein